MLTLLHLSFCLKSKGYRNDVFDVFSTGPEDSSDTGTLAEGPAHVPTLAGMLEDARDRAVGTGLGES